MSDHHTYRLCNCLAWLIIIVCLFNPAFRKTLAANNNPIPTKRYWLFYTEPERSPDELEEAKQAVAEQLSPRSLKRRQKMIASNPPVRLCDLPPPPEFVNSIEQTGCRIVHVARYLKAVSIEGTAEQFVSATALPFVKSSRPVMGFASSRMEDTPVHEFKGSSDLIADSADYGFSYRHSAVVNIQAAHNLGYRGRGILIGVQDTGFSNLRHRCFTTLDIVAAYDFVNGDNNVANHGDLGDGAHGSKVLSVIAGIDSGFYIGVAPEAEFVLTKTENTIGERPIEEDAWVAGLWFHDSTGTEVLSSSLSYDDWYNYEDMDGQTAVTSIAADSAVAAGIVILNSAGNNGRDGYPNDKVGAPADAQRVITVGGVLTDSSKWTGASIGPTFDGRIKPDVSAQSVGVYVASTRDLTTYQPSNGTSFSTPTVSGIVALILEANHDLTPYQVINILHQTSHMAQHPDTLRGYGIPNAVAAIRLAESMSVRREINPPVEFVISAYPNPFNRRLYIDFGREGVARTIKLIDMHGRVVRNFQNYQAESSIDFSGLSAGSYIVRAEGIHSIDAVRIVYLP